MSSARSQAQANWPMCAVLSLKEFLYASIACVWQDLWKDSTPLGLGSEYLRQKWPQILEQSLVAHPVVCFRRLISSYHQSLRNPEEKTLSLGMVVDTCNSNMGG